MDEVRRPGGGQDGEEAPPDYAGQPRSGPSRVSRRAVLAAGRPVVGATVAAGAATMSRRGGGDDRPFAGTSLGAPEPTAGPGRLLARPGAPIAAPPGPGVHPIGLGGGRDGLLLVPAGHRPGVPVPLVVSLHGAGGNAEGGLAPLRGLADGAGVVLVAPESRGATWDVIQGGFGPDVSFLDQALAHAFGRFVVDTRRMAIAGFSDGASYALSLGVGNGDLFTHCIAFSPGFMAPPARLGRPRLFVTHGVHDAVLPIDRCSRRLVPRLRRDGYDVDYREFDGPHVVPPDQAAAAVAWLGAP